MNPVVAHWLVCAALLMCSDSYHVVQHGVYSGQTFAFSWLVNDANASIDAGNSPVRLMLLIRSDDISAVDAVSRRC